MTCILLIESSTQICSVAVSCNKKIVWSMHNSEVNSHSSVVGVFINEAVVFVKENNYQIKAVAVSAGPGSYTGLRIGISIAKGLCYGWNIPLIAIPTLKIIAARLIPSSSYLCPMIDARRMEVYAALYDGHLKELDAAKPVIVDEGFYSDILAKKEIIFFGNGSDKCKRIINSPNAIFVDNIHPLADNMNDEALRAFEEKIFANLAYFEPFYLKDFQATIPKNKVIKNY